MFYIYKIRWSQTDVDTVIVEADSQAIADEVIDDKYVDARYREKAGSTDMLIRFPILNPLSTATVIKA